MSFLECDDGGAWLAVGIFALDGIYRGSEPTAWQRIATKEIYADLPSHLEFA